jgi:type I restriction enzyme M protein
MPLIDFSSTPFGTSLKCQPIYPAGRRLSYLKPEHQERIADAYHAFKDVEGFAQVASLADIRANDGNLSIPLYVRGKAVSDEKGVYAADGLKAAVKAWEKSSGTLNEAISGLLKMSD